MSEHDCTIPLKRCTKCGAEYPATTEFFHYKDRKKQRLCAKCKDCESQRRHLRRILHHDDVLSSERARRAANPDKKKEYDRQRYTQTRQTVIERVRLYSLKHPERVRAYKRRHKPDLVKRRISCQRYRAYKRALPATFTPEQWQECLNWWHDVCAYCGAQQSLFHVLEQDHFVPVTAGGGYTADNIVPACASCNPSKCDTPAGEWIESKFGKRRGAKIMERIEEYFEWRSRQ